MPRAPTSGNAATPLPRIKDPERCPHCNSPRVIRKGTRTKKLETVRRFHCRSCGRTFTPGPRALRNKTYPLHEIFDAITLYCRGHSLTEVAKRLSSRHGHRVNPSTISRWLAEHASRTTYRRLRAKGRALFTPAQIIRTIKLYHRQVYEFGYHRAKLAFVRDGSLDPSRTSRSRTARHAFAPLADFLESVPTTCPHDLFRRKDGARGSQLGDVFLALDGAIITERQSVATATAALVLPTVGTNYERHPKLQRFMLASDSSTVAVEVPLWLTEDEIAALEQQHGVTLVPKEPVAESAGARHKPRHFTGHVDFLQVRNGAVHILDYKPDARTNQPLAQLTMYALALTVRVPGLKLFDIKCAWFNERCYNEFFPRTLLPHRHAPGAHTLEAEVAGRELLTIRSRRRCPRDTTMYTEFMAAIAQVPSLIGSIRRFGPAGVLYEVLADIDGTVARIRILDTGEETQYRIADILRDPTE